MRIAACPADLQASALALRRGGRRIGLVPTMGCLHEGHLALVRRARAEADAVIVSLFVNPTQFGPAEDFAKYPRPFDRDAELCRAEGVDLLFAPPPEAMYAPDHSVWVDEVSLSRGLCGASRPGHFRGVCTVVAKLFNLALPDVAVFGEKDGQQLRVIRRMVRDLGFPVRIVAVPTVREPDGLAMSSRNRYLSPAERGEAPALRRALDRAEVLAREGERDAARLRAAMEEVLRREAPSARVDYLDIVDDETLEPVTTLARPAMVAMAVFIGKTRLIDNTVLRAGGRRTDGGME